jgi:fluoride ion exporter CrcB/FEX
MSGGAKLSEPPADTIGEPNWISPKRCSVSINRTIGVRDGPRPSSTPVSRTAKELPAGMVSEGAATVALGAVITAVGNVEPGVNPGILLVVATGTVVIGTVVVTSVDAASGSAIVVAGALGVLTTFTESAYSGSVINMIHMEITITFSTIHVIHEIKMRKILIIYFLH